jgi:site-specific DNA-cytosine methylase
MNVLSVFDGMSCGQIALERAGIKVNRYFASEIDPYAVKIAEKNYPDTMELGDVTKISCKNNKLKSSHYYNNSVNIDLLIGGSPCQDLSFANEEKLGLEGKKSNLFWHFVRLLKETKPRFFLLENVRMEKKWQDVISKALGVEPIKINSALVSAQSRNRLYWTNIPYVYQPYDKGLVFRDILVKDNKVPRKYFYLPKSVEYFDRAPMNRRFCNYLDAKKGKCVTANFRKAAPYNLFVTFKKEFGEKHSISFLANMGRGQSGYNQDVRKLTPLECERLQTLPERYTEGVSDTQRYAMIGNGWTVDVVAHILRGIITQQHIGGGKDFFMESNKVVRLTSKKPTAWDVMAHQALHLGKSSGIEPIFNTFYRRIIDGKEVVITGDTKQ